MTTEIEAAEYDFYFNGVDAETGGYITPPTTGKSLSQAIYSDQDVLITDHMQQSDLRTNLTDDNYSFERMRERYSDHNDLKQTGWGIIYAAEDSEHFEEIKKALKALIALRQEQAGEVKYLKYQSGESVIDFLKRYKIYDPAAAADPKKIPYYLLIVASPNKISYQVQYLLDGVRAVGRLFFDTLEEYTLYARGVVAAETKKIVLPREATFFTVANKGDEATRLSTTHLVNRLVSNLEEDYKDKWKLNLIGPDDAYKENLNAILREEKRPPLLFTATHGLKNSKRPLHQGAFVCQDWRPGLLDHIPSKQYFSADDLTDAHHLQGMISFHFACYGAGTPMHDDFPYKNPMLRVRQKSKFPYMAQLPRKMLSHPSGGSLAYIGHVDRAWSYAFLKGENTYTDTFEDTLGMLLDGNRLGYAMEPFNYRYANLAVHVLSKLQSHVTPGENTDLAKLANDWTHLNDARNYLIIGDPAVRLSVDETETAIQNPVERIELIITGPAHNEEKLPEVAQNISPIPIEEGPLDEDEFDEEPSSFVPNLGRDDQAHVTDPALDQAWRAHVIEGINRHDQMFSEVMTMFRRPYWITVILYVIWFGSGVASFFLAIYFANRGQNDWSVAIFGGMSAITFLSFFFNRPLKALERNILLGSRLSLALNSYWLRLAYASKAESFDKNVVEITNEAIRLIDEQIRLHSHSD